MRQIRRLLGVLLALCALLALLPAALAEEPGDPEEDERFAGKTWDELVEEFLQTWRTDAKDVGLGYYNTVTGEEHYVNPDEYRITASMYKVPLNMVFLDRLSKGEMDWDTNVAGYPYETVLEQTIVRSNNDIARSMVKWELGNGNWQEGRRALAAYHGLDPATVDWKFRENNYSTPRQMIYCLRLLYENPDRFPRLVETMQQAEPTEYFKRREQRFDIAHKYGYLQTDDGHLYINDCGIAFTDDPILLVAFTDNNLKAFDVLTEYCTLMCDYTQYHRAQRLRQEAEEAERLEAERLAAEEAERLRLEASETEPAPAEEPELPEATEAPALPEESAAPAAPESPEPVREPPAEATEAPSPVTEAPSPAAESPAPGDSEPRQEEKQPAGRTPNFGRIPPEAFRIFVLSVFGAAGLGLLVLLITCAVKRGR
ncbi:MAG: serine hydrolase [Oscillospiraceae bacterium]|nr:serine hydrolase [Oscillospiraceae bacterium]